MKPTFARYAAAIIAAGTLAITSVAVSQSGTSPSGSPSREKSPPGSGTNPSGTKRAEARAPKIIALNFYADWCPSCKALKPNLEEAMALTASQPCLFVQLDQTDKNSTQAEYLLAVLGAGKLWTEYGGQTGFVLLIDARTKRVVEKISSSQNAKSIAAAIASATRG